MKLIVSFCLCSIVVCQSQPPFPTKTVERNQPERRAERAQKPTGTNEHGTEQSPIVVKGVPSAKTQDKTLDGTAQELHQSSPDWWMVRLTGAIVFIGFVQTIVFGLQALRLKQTIEKMEEIAGKQTLDVQASIVEATRAAQAMERVSESLALNAESVGESVRITREIADRQRLITELQSRAYLLVLFEGMVPQNIAAKVKFEPRIRIENKGSTPAHNIRFAIRADVLSFPLRDDFTFPLLTDALGYSSAIGPGLHKIILAVVPNMYTEAEAEQIASGLGQRIVTWGIVKYEDAFHIERYVRFGFTHIRIGENNWMSQDTTQNNESD